jgi:hypothetical protein
MNRPTTLATLAALAAVAACKDEPKQSGEFFDPAALEEGAAELGEDFTVVPCKGAEDLQRWEWHPRLVRGQVLAPGGALVQNGASPLYDWLIPSAHAVPLEGESVVADATVRLVQGDSQRHETTTDALGRFCLVVPVGEELGPAWRIEAVGADITLRRVLLDAVEADVSVQTEAVYRVVTDGRRAEDVSPHDWRNMSTMSATVLDLTDPLEITPGMSASTAVDAAVERMRGDGRIEKTLDSLR